MLIFYLALAVVEFLAILRFFTKQKLNNISGNHAATWKQKLAADFPHRNKTRVQMPAKIFPHLKVKC
jgi:hypothetical protein